MDGLGDGLGGGGEAAGTMGSTEGELLPVADSALATALVIDTSSVEDKKLAV